MRTDSMACLIAEAEQVEQRVHTLSRTFLDEDCLSAVLARETPTLRILTGDELAASLRATLAAKPDGDAWPFGYGSLIWNPTVHTLERRVARIMGWRRSFCLSATAGRGSAEMPGLLLGLEEGGYCDGVAFRLDGHSLADELARL